MNVRECYHKGGKWASCKWQVASLQVGK